MSSSAALRKMGLKATLPRIKIFEFLQNSDERHLSAEDIYKAMLIDNEEVGLATIYRVLTQFDEQDATIARERRMTESFRIEQECARRPVTLLIGEHAVQHQYLFAVGMAMFRKTRIPVVANDGRHLSGFRGSDPMNAFAPDAAARARRPRHRSGVYRAQRIQVTMNRIRHRQPFS